MAVDRVLDATASALGPQRGAPALSVAFSGGVDSSVLLEALRRLAPALGLPAPRALHVDHGLEAQAPAWRAHCQRVCRAHDLPFRALSVHARADPGHSPEEAARDARYAALASALVPGELLCTAHHANDQAETVLLGLLRGCGVAGSAAMAPQRALPPGRLLRPLLGVGREVIERCAREWALEWVEDPSNARADHPRNRLRHEILPLLESMAPAAVACLGRSAALHREAARLVDDLAEQDLAACRAGDDGALSRAALAVLPGRRRRAVLRRWLASQGLRAPPRARLAELARQLVEARAGRCPRIALDGAEVRAHGNRAVLLAGRGAGARPAAAPASRQWRPGEALELPAGRLWAEPAAAGGLRDAPLLEVRWRAGGARCRPAGRRHSQTLKRLLQELRVPPWERAGLPLLYRDGVLAGVADLFVCHGHEARPGERGWRVRWQAR